MIIAVIGGIAHLEGAWVGAFVFVAANNYLRDLPLIDKIGITEARFNTVIGALVLLIVVLSPDGLMGIFEKVRNALKRTFSGKRFRPSASQDQPKNMTMEGTTR